MKVHTRLVSIPCPVQYCPRQGSRAFYRWDKLSDHLRNGHTESEECRCLVEGCTAANIPLSLLRFHARHHYVRIASPQLQFSYDFVKMLCSSESNRKCDLRRCKRWFAGYAADTLQQHLSTHSLDERLAQSNIIREMGFDPNTIAIVCPICQRHFANSSQFVPHLEATHLATDGGHWLSFSAQVSDHMAHPHIWEPSFGDVGVRSRYDQFMCHHCGETELNRDKAWSNHCIGLLKKQNLDEVVASRAIILRLLPDFASHPVLEMDRPIVHSR